MEHQRTALLFLLFGKDVLAVFLRSFLVFLHAVHPTCLFSSAHKASKGRELVKFILQVNKVQK